LENNQKEIKTCPDEVELTVNIQPSRFNMIYLLFLLSLTILNGFLLYKMAVLIKREYICMNTIVNKTNELDILMKDFNEIFVPEMEAHAKKCLFRYTDTKNKNINKHTVDFVTTVGKPNDK